MQLDNVQYSKYNRDYLHQGDIFSNVSILLDVEMVDDELVIKNRMLPYLIIMTQECDLEQDYKNRKNNLALKPDTSDIKHDKYLPSILLCPAYPAESLKQGTHLKECGLVMERFNSERYKSIEQNNISRYHFLEMNKDFGIPQLIVDFKHYFTIPREKIDLNDFQINYIATISGLFKADISLRFCQYLSRIGLPDTQS